MSDQSDQTQPAKPPDTAPPPAPKTPLDPPVVYYNKVWRTPPLVMDFKEDADALDTNEWMTNPPADAGGASKEDQYPKLYYDVNVPPVLAGSADDEKKLDKSRYREYPISESLIKSSQAQLDAAAKKTN